MVTKPTISQTGKFNFYAGAVTITLRQSNNGKVLPGREIVLYEKSPGGNRKWQAKASTDAKGRVFFDPSGLKQNKIYFAFTKNLFGKTNRYYSPWITKKGNVDFAVDPKGNTPLDFKPPLLNISSPSNGTVVSDAGFVLRGFASDDDKVTKIIVSVDDPSAGISTANAAIKNGYWNFPVTAAMIDPNHSVTLQVKAYDPSKNETTSTLKVKVISDTKRPSLRILSHKTGDTVAHTGFLLSGSVKDNTGISSLIADVVDSKLGSVVSRANIEIAQGSGKWALAVGKLSKNGTVSVSITAQRCRRKQRYQNNVVKYYSGYERGSTYNKPYNVRGNTEPT